jgi:hypothetical protein
VFLNLRNLAMKSNDLTQSVSIFIPMTRNLNYIHYMGSEED